MSLKSWVRALIYTVKKKRDSVYGNSEDRPTEGWFRLLSVESPETLSRDLTTVHPSKLFVGICKGTRSKARFVIFLGIRVLTGNVSDMKPQFHYDDDKPNLFPLFLSVISKDLSFPETTYQTLNSATGESL